MAKKVLSREEQITDLLRSIGRASQGTAGQWHIKNWLEDLQKLLKPEQELLLAIVRNEDGTMQILPNNGDPVAVPEYAMVTAHPDKGEVHFRPGMSSSSKTEWGLVRVTKDQPDSTEGE